MVSYHVGDVDDKAGYNQAGRIVESLSMLRATYLSSKLVNNLSEMLEAIRCVLDVIAGKVDNREIDEMNELIYTIESELPSCEIRFKWNGGSYFKFPSLRLKVKRDIESLYRKLEKLQDKYGYGMLSQKDPRFAVMRT